MNLVPIVFFVYNRPWHTKQTVEALQKNKLARESELFIYSDEAKNEDAQKNVDEVRKYIDKIDGFKKVTVIKRENRYMKFVKRLINGPMIGSNNVDIVLFPHPRKVNVDSKFIDI